jgi:NADPH-dependent glutamate synthase beta subunit-like oxidoreductase
MQKPFAITLDVGSSLVNHTGSWRNSRPVYVSRKPPCNHQCPAGENIQAWLFHAESGHYEQAWRKLVEDNPFPATMGRVCYHTCEGACNRAKIDEAVGINSVEGFLGDQAIARGWKFAGGKAPSGKKGAGRRRRSVRSVGGLPSGPPGPCRDGARGRAHARRHDAFRHSEIPSAPPGARRRGPAHCGHGRHHRLQHQGLERAGVPPSRRLRRRVPGRRCPHCEARVHPAGDSAKVLDAVAVLRSMEGEDKPMLGRRVVVYGGGNTAIDVARTAKRLGASEAIIVYRRNREKMPAHDFEVEEALQEGVMIKWLSTIKQAGESSITVEKMALDDKGFPQPTGEFETLEADSVVLALGQDVDLSLIEGVPGLAVDDGVVQVDAQMMTGHAGIFAGGDMVPAERNVTVAIGHGKKAARNIDAWLQGASYQAPAKNELASFDKLNPWYYSDAPKTVRPMLDILRRKSTFEEVQGGLDESNALFEARRCLSCGNCFECDNCYGVCPDNAVIKHGPGKGFDFNLDYCKGCGICVAECPSGSIKMVPEDMERRARSTGRVKSSNISQKKNSMHWFPSVATGL